MILDGVRLYKSCKLEAAKHMFRQAQKLDPRMPDAYYYLARSFGYCRVSESLTYSEKATELFAEALLRDYAIQQHTSPTIGHDNGHSSKKLQALALSISLTIDQSFKDLSEPRFAQVNRDKPTWITNDQTLDRISRIALRVFGRHSEDALMRERHWDMAWTRAMFLMGGYLSNGQSKRFTPREPPENRSLENIREACGLLEWAIKSAEWMRKSDLEKLGITKTYVTAQRYATCMRDLEAWGGLRSPPQQYPQAFSWVQISGLRGIPGDVLNNKLGIVHEAKSLNDGRVTVKVDGIDGHKHMFPQYLVVLPLRSLISTMVLCLDEGVQWMFMRAYYKHWLLTGQPARGDRDRQLPVGIIE
ncbi:expressed unknown protein [Seminavis robusta]|uniref:Uncharacterized protein n=1 Tax=Seminavis robusta TaxID=568900 RepID=A0A9N8ECY5_9STRA|nr:expressed unknown protein [Seminavis robusta]|eukprot:Sro770_g199901.1  (359) ;mRNA; f:2399-3475